MAAILGIRNAGVTCLHVWVSGALRRVGIFSTLYFAGDRQAGQTKYDVHACHERGLRGWCLKIAGRQLKPEAACWSGRQIPRVFCGYSTGIPRKSTSHAFGKAIIRVPMSSVISVKRLHYRCRQAPSAMSDADSAGSHGRAGKALRSAGAGWHEFGSSLRQLVHFLRLRQGLQPQRCKCRQLQVLLI